MLLLQALAHERNTGLRERHVERAVRGGVCLLLTLAFEQDTGIRKLHVERAV